jgi:hypothetical protein
MEDGRAAHGGAILRPARKWDGEPGQPLGSTAMVTSGVRPAMTRMATL